MRQRERCTESGVRTTAVKLSQSTELAFADRKTSAARDPTRKRPSAFDVPGGHLPRILTVWMVGEVGW